MNIRRMHKIVLLFHFIVFLLCFTTGCATPSIVGKTVKVDPDHVIVTVDKEHVLRWPSDPNVRENIKGAEDLNDMFNGIVLFESIYDLDDSGYWHNKKVYIVIVNKEYFLVAEEGVSLNK